MTDNKCNSSTSKRLDELLEMAKNRGNVEEVKANKLPAALVPVRHPQKDFFIADILDVSIKDDLASMEHPLFALKAGDMRVKTYERNGNSVVASTSGNQSAACSQNGGWYLTSTISAAATTMAPASMMMKIAGPSPESMKA